MGLVKTRRLAAMHPSSRCALLRTSRDKKGRTLPYMFYCICLTEEDAKCQFLRQIAWQIWYTTRQKGKDCGTCENQKTEISAPCGRRRPVGKSAGRALRVPSDAEAAAREGGDEAADEEGGLGATTVFT